MALISMNLSSGCLRMKTDVMVVLPFYSPYDIAAGKRDEIFPIGKQYQVLWLLHGGNGNDWPIPYTGADSHWIIESDIGNLAHIYTDNAGEWHTEYLGIAENARLSELGITSIFGGRS